MRDRSGVIGRSLISLPVMMLIIFIMGLFVFLAGVLFVLEGPEVPSVIEGVTSDLILFKEVDVGGERQGLLNAVVKANLYYEEALLLRVDLERDLDEDEMKLFRARLNKIENYVGLLKEEIREIYSGENDLVYSGESRCLVIATTNGHDSKVSESVALAGNLAGANIGYAFAEKYTGVVKGVKQLTSVGRYVELVKNIDLDLKIEDNSDAISDALLEGITDEQIEEFSDNSVVAVPQLSKISIHYYYGGCLNE